VPPTCCNVSVFQNNPKLRLEVMVRTNRIHRSAEMCLFSKHDPKYRLEVMDGINRIHRSAVKTPPKYRL